MSDYCYKSVVPVLSVFLSVLCLAADLNAQGSGTVGGTDIQVFNITGSVSTEAHAYTTTRSVSRRAPLGNVTTANTNFSVLGFDSGLNLRYNTDDSRFRQSMNEIGFSGSWRWIRLSAGDVSPSWSRFSLSGTRIRGGSLEFTPGNLLLELTGGRAARAVGPREDEPVHRLTYRRMLYGARIGYGNQSRSYFLLSGFYARDDEESINVPDEFMALNGQDPQMESGTGQSRRNFTPPAENLVVSPEFQVSLFRQALQVGGRGSISAFTHDLRTQQIDASEVGVPDFLTDIMGVHSSTRLGYAGMAHARLRINPADFQLEYERIQPGFETLGIRSMRDDRQRYTASLGLDLFNRRLQFNNSIGYHEDNLLGDRVQTQHGLDYSVDATAQLSSSVSVSTGYGLTTNETKATDPDVEVGRSEHASHTIRLQPMVNLTRDQTTHSFTLSGFYQTFESIRRFEDDERISDGRTFNAMLGYNVSLFGGLRFNTSVNGLTGRAAGSDIQNLGFNAGTGYTFFDGRLNTNLNAGLSRNKISRSAPGSQVPAGENGQNGNGSVSQNDSRIHNISWQFNGNARLSYRVLDAASLDLSLRTNNNMISEGSGSGFSEFESRLGFSYRF